MVSVKFYPVLYMSRHHLLSFRMQLYAKSFQIKRRMNGFYKINGGMYAGVLKKANI